jgi:hypothetical protein
MWRETPTLLGRLETANLRHLTLSKGLNRVGASVHTLRTEPDPFSETLFSCIQNSGRWTKSGNPVILSVLYGVIPEH